MSIRRTKKNIKKHSSPVIQLFLIFKHSKRFHSITEFLGIVVVYFTGGSKANGRGDAIVFLGLLPTRHGAARKQGASSLMTATAQRHYTFKTHLILWRGISPSPVLHNEHFGIWQIVTKSMPIFLNANVWLCNQTAYSRTNTTPLCPIRTTA